jgi:serine/threonine protein kinase
MTPEDAAREQGARKPERWQQIEQLFHAALEQQPGGRATFLAEACAGDQALRREVESLLAYKSHDGGFMETPVLEAAPRLLAEGQAESLVGRQVGLHKILSRLGAGGMGEVYRARDMKLGRDVALKVLPAAFARDPERVGRFRREAHMLAQLNHPNIAAIYAVDETDGVLFLALELVPGETLAERLTSSPLDVREALRICVQIAEALEAAHQKGVIHRDIKPANVKVTPEGKVKVLDFGLAKAFAGEGSGPDLSALPTAAGGGTRTGVIPGTPAYMSPEQARGKQLDKRTDIWSFGCVLYELLARRRAFPGETIPDTIAALLGREPDWGALPEGTPAGIHRLLRRCLEKDPNRRLRDVGDGRIEIEDALTGAPASPAPAPGVSQSKGRGRLAWAVAAVLA